MTSRCVVLKFQDQLFSGPEILGPHNNVGKIVRSLSGPETPGPFSFSSIGVQNIEMKSDGPDAQHFFRLKSLQLASIAFM